MTDSMGPAPPAAGVPDLLRRDRCGHRKQPPQNGRIVFKIATKRIAF
jgi:hypothetical protein